MKFNETIKDNLSGSQITTLLERFIFAALKPLCYNTTIIRRIFADILVQTYNDNRRKISVLDKQVLIDLIYSSVVVIDNKQSWTSLKKSSIERLILIRILDLFLNLTKDYLYYEQCFLHKKSNFYEEKMKNIENLLGADRKRLSAIVRNTQCNTDFYYKFKQMVVEKYIKLAYAESCKTKKLSNNINIDSEELFKNLILAIDRAIDKYSPERGALSSYVQWWFKDAKINSEFGHEYGQTMQVSGGTRRSIADKHSKGLFHLNTFTQNIQDHLDIESDDNTEQDLMNRQQENSLLIMINKLKNCNLAKLFLEVPYILSPTDKQKLLKTQKLIL